ncbi:hypothetical protein ONZ43_g4286 [Nemania bipapillata]|uniref:Uncharacterized protein n=1 Tax=Nemania bipapillata TaxID=110536 RepID=A0ACC2IPW4_9PEZI|nr:hypothetical protein ONZ43_g4286 [Nemania bipapillata]
MSLDPAVKRDGFAFLGGFFYAEVSGHNRHPRATVAELKEHFKSGSDKGFPAHWFEAQLIHYGLQPSKTKSVARMRLFDAVNSGKLVVPLHTQKLEKELKKEWTKKEREAKKAMDTKASTSTAPPPGNKKRKADASNVDMTINVGGINISVSANNASASSSATKKAKTSATTDAKPTTPATPAKKQTARRGGISQGPSRGSTSTAGRVTTTPARGLPMARRSGASVARGRIPTSSGRGRNDDFDEPPPPYREYDHDSYDNNDSRGSYYSRDSRDSRDAYGDSDGYDNTSPSRSLGPLGLLNGRYNIVSEKVYDTCDCDDLDLVLTLSKSELWGKFDLGIVRGIMHFSERPWQSSYDRLPFDWCGEDMDGTIRSGNENCGWIKFLGDGRIEGEISYMGLDFSGERISGQSTRSEVDAQSMWREWDGYCE